MISRVCTNKISSKKYRRSLASRLATHQQASNSTTWCRRVVVTRMTCRIITTSRTRHSSMPTDLRLAASPAKSSSSRRPYRCILNLPSSTRRQVSRASTPRAWRRLTSLRCRETPLHRPFPIKEASASIVRTVGLSAWSPRSVEFTYNIKMQR